MHRILSWIKYYFRATNAHGIHSPFIFQVYNEIIHGSVPSNFNSAKEWEKVCKGNSGLISFTDYGKEQGIQVRRKVSEIAHRTETSGKYGALLHRLAAAFQPEYILELGTCLGIGSLYTLSGLEKSPEIMVTMEGGDALADLAESALTRFYPDYSVHVVRGNINDTLPGVIRDVPVLDWVYFDANHRLKPTLAYAEQCMTRVRDGSLFILDDIHWSPEMEEAWKILCEDPRCTLTIDLYRMGLIFFKKDQAKEHFVLRF